VSQSLRTDGNSFHNDKFYHMRKRCYFQLFSELQVLLVYAAVTSVSGKGIADFN
jgi:hypothetical protein